MPTSARLYEPVNPPRDRRCGAQYRDVTTLARTWTADEPAAEERTAEQRCTPRSSGADLRSAFAECAEAVYRFILYRVGHDRSAADDILQDCCHEAARHRNPPLHVEQFGPWFIGIARNLVLRHWRRRRRDQRWRPLDDPAISRRVLERLESRDLPAEAVLPDDELTQLMAAVTDLSPDEQRLIIAVYFQDQPLGQIATERGTTAKSVEAKMYRIRTKLRDRLRGEARASQP